MRKKFTRLKACIFFKGSGKMGNRRVTEHHRYFCNCQAFFIKKVFGMFHSLALIKVEDGTSKHFLKALFQVAFIHCYFTAKRLYCNGLTYMLKKELSSF